MKLKLIIGLLVLVSSSLYSQTIINASKVILDYNGSGAAASSDAALNWGDGYGAENITLIAALRQGVLPVKLLSFTGKSDAEVINLKWSTSWEKENSRFEIWRSSDNKTFSFLGSIGGKGTTQVQSVYGFTDHSPLAGFNYYQLKQFDQNGKETVLSIIPVAFGLNKSEFEVFVLSQAELGFSIYSEDRVPAAVAVSDILGRKLLSAKINLEKGSNTLSLSSSLSAGVYIASFTVKGKTQYKKIIL